MLHLINEGNKALKHRKFPIPEKLLKHLQDTKKEYDDTNLDKNTKGYQRLCNLINDMANGIPYDSEMRRLKNFFDNYKGTDESWEYKLNGGDKMKCWVTNTLETAEKSVKDDSKLSLLKKRDTKSIDRQTQINRSKGIGKFDEKPNEGSVEIRYESIKNKKTIVLNEEQYKIVTKLFINK